MLILRLRALLVKPHRLHVSGMTPPRWDLPARILTATLLVVTLTSLSGRIGPQLSGMLSPFPAFSLIFAAFTHAQQGGKSEPVTTEAGQSSNCHLPDGRVVEEWTLYRADHPAPAAGAEN